MGEKNNPKKPMVEKPETDIEAMPIEILQNAHTEQQWIMPDHLPTAAYGTVILPGVEVYPEEKEKPTYTPSGDMPPNFS